MDHIEKSLTLKYSAASMEELLVDGADKLAQAELTLVLGNRYYVHASLKSDVSSFVVFVEVFACLCSSG